MNIRTQNGAALLLFMLLIIVSASFMLTRDLNSMVNRVTNHEASIAALQQAKMALMGWAINHPTNPGALPMPDRNSDVDGYDGDSDCANISPINNNLLIGKLPWREVPSPCKDAGVLPGLQINVRDSAGEHLWYAVSHNLIYETPSYPFISPGILAKSSGWITVRNQSGDIISDRVAFVIIAPGFAIGNQDRSGSAPAIENYLDSVVIGGNTYNNANFDQDFIIYPDSDLTANPNDSFNDKLLFVTIDELMTAVSKRVLNETGNILTKYHNAHGALPWLTDFADPKADAKWLTGTHKGASNSLSLQDTAADFTKWNITLNQDKVWNLTDGSYGVITAVTATELTLGAGLLLGTDNDFDAGDEYYVEIKKLADTLIGNATLGSSGNTLQDVNKDFEKYGVMAGDIIENINDGGSVGVISSVAGDTLTVVSLNGGTNNVFNVTDQYRIRSNSGWAGPGSSANILDDPMVDFTAMGVQAGELIRNLSTGLSGVIITVAGNSLTVAPLPSAASISFTPGDNYILPRFNGVTGNRRGLLPIHEPGEGFITGFNMEWKAIDTLGGNISTNAPGARLEYIDGLKNWAQGPIGPNFSNAYTDAVIVPAGNGECLWLQATIADCSGEATDSNFLSGTVTAIISASEFQDANRLFDTSGVNRGDKLINLINGTQALITQAVGNNINWASITGETAFSINSGDEYRIYIATKSIAGNAGPNTNIAINRVYDSAPDFSAIEKNVDVVVNISSGGVGVITDKGVDGLLGPWFEYSSLQGGSSADINVNDDYVISHDHIDRREYQFNIRMSGTSDVNDVAGARVRGVCQGFGVADCASAPGDVTLNIDNTVPFVTISDYDSSNNLLGTVANATIASADGAIKLSNINYYLDKDAVNGADLPAWFVRNRWHQYIYVTYSDAEAPASATNCTTGPPCLTLNIETITKDDIRALIMLSGEALAATSPPQSWPAGTLDDYFDLAVNTDADDLFQKNSSSNIYNDLIRIAVSCPPPDNSKLCWFE